MTKNSPGWTNVLEKLKCADMVICVLAGGSVVWNFEFGSLNAGLKFGA